MANAFAIRFSEMAKPVANAPHSPECRCTECHYAKCLCRTCLKWPNCWQYHKQIRQN